MAGRAYETLVAFSPLAFILYLIVTFLAWNFVLGFLLFRVFRLRLPDEGAGPPQNKEPTPPEPCSYTLSPYTAGGGAQMIFITTYLPPQMLSDAPYCPLGTTIIRRG